MHILGIWKFASQIVIIIVLMFSLMALFLDIFNYFTFDLLS